jgi:hypothetical protein
MSKFIFFFSSVCFFMSANGAGDDASGSDTTCVLYIPNCTKDCDPFYDCGDFQYEVLFGCAKDCVEDIDITILENAWNARNCTGALFEIDTPSCLENCDRFSDCVDVRSYCDQSIECVTVSMERWREYQSSVFTFSRLRHRPTRHVSLEIDIDTTRTPTLEHRYKMNFQALRDVRSIV